MIFGIDFDFTLPCACLETKSLNRKEKIREPQLSVTNDRPSLEVESRRARFHLFLASSEELLYTALRRGFFIFPCCP